MKNPVWNLRLCSLILGVVLASCTAIEPEEFGGRAPQPMEIPPTEPNPLIGTQWQLAAYGAPDNQIFFSTDKQPILTFHESSLEGNTGCNNYGSEYTIDGNNLAFEMLFWTEMACLEPGLMEQESSYLSILGAVETFHLDNEILTLTGPEGVLNFEPIVAPAERPLVRRLWQLKAISADTDTVASVERIPEDKVVTIWFEDRRVGGQTGCNRYSAPYETMGIGLVRVTGPVEMTLTECIDEESSNLERRFIEALQAAEAYLVEGDRLTITFPSGQLIFRSKGENQVEETAVYTAVIREWESVQNACVVREETRFNKPGATMEETLEFVRRQLPPLNENDPFSLDPETLVDYERRNASPTSLSENWHSALPTTFISEAELRELFQGEQGADWETFHVRYPDKQAIYIFSRVGFNQSGDQALVYFGILSEEFNGGYYHLLSKSDGLWSSVMSFMIWGP